MNDAFTALPPTSSQIGRANKWAAKALLARVYLYNEMWEEAEKAAEAVIKSNKYSLFPDYRNLFSRDHENNIFIQLSYILEMDWISCFANSTRLLRLWI